MGAMACKRAAWRQTVLVVQRIGLVGDRIDRGSKVRAVGKGVEKPFSKFRIPKYQAGGGPPGAEEPVVDDHRLDGQGRIEVRDVFRALHGKFKSVGNLAGGKRVRDC